MKKKIIGIFAVTLLIVTMVPISGNENNTALKSPQAAIFLEIDETQHKMLIVDKYIGNIHVKYWEHVVNGIQVKNDSILLHTDPDSREIINYEKSWSNVEDFLSHSFNEAFEPNDYFWKKRIVFPDAYDCVPFFYFNKQEQYPLICWEVRHTDGSTILYDINGTKIGYGIPAPSEQGFSISNDCGDGYGDCWKSFRENADQWFQRWCDSTICIGLPNLEEISLHIQNRNTTFFFELGHSHHLPTRFLVTDEIYYNASHLQQDMTQRQPMKFAFIGSCEGLREIYPGTLSYEFRKGKMNNTVTVGYVGMADCPGWNVALHWQDYLFQEMDSGRTIKESFDLASAKYPTIADCVRFVGDERLTVRNHPPCPPETPLGSSINPPHEIVCFNTTTFDSEGDLVHYFFDWDDGTDSGWLGPYNYGEYAVSSHQWNTNGYYSVKVKAKDEHHIESEYSGPLNITITHPPSKPKTPWGLSSGKPGRKYTFTTSSNDPDGDMVYYMWDWGDGNFSEWLSTNKASYTWKKEAKFNIRVKAKDNYGVESDWSDPLVFSTPKNKSIQSPFLYFLEHHPHLFLLLQLLLHL